MGLGHIIAHVTEDGEVMTYTVPSVVLCEYQEVPGSLKVLSRAQ